MFSTGFHDFYVLGLKKRRLKISKNATLDAPSFNFDDLLMPFGLLFSINFRDHLNLLSYNNYHAKTFFLQFQAFHFGIKNQSKNNVFSTPLSGDYFSHFMLICLRNYNFWDPFEIQWAPNSADTSLCQALSSIRM